MMRLLILFLAFCTAGYAENNMVLVTVAPYVEIIEMLTDKSVQCELVVPPGASFHDYEPTPKQMLRAQKAKIWFGIGEPFEQKVSAFLLKHNPQFMYIDLREGVQLLTSSCSHHGHESYDPHMWLSPQIMEQQTKTIAHALVKAFPECTGTIEKNLPLILQKLSDLDAELRKLFANKHDLVVLVAHPAYGYFCDAYGIKQLSIEHDGKEPTAKQLTHLIVEAKKLHIHRVFTQGQYPSKGAILVAHEIDAQVISLQPYAQNYFEAMREIGKQFSEVKS
jgi:zinc transport system substrate-binding protein